MEPDGQKPPVYPWKEEGPRFQLKTTVSGSSVVAQVVLNRLYRVYRAAPNVC